MSIPKPSGEFGQVVSINSVKHELPLDQMINSMVRTSRLQLPYGNYECTRIFHQAGRATLQDITPDGKAYFETFKRAADFNEGFTGHVKTLGENMALQLSRPVMRMPEPSPM